MMRSTTIVSILLTVFLAAPAGAALITIHNTGLASTTSPDPNWQVNGGTVYVTDDSGFPIGPWFANTASSRWISPSPSYTGGQTDAPGNHNFSTDFDLTGYLHTTASLVFDVAVDNNLLDVLINGTSTGITATGFAGFDAGGPFAINSGFQAGVNTVTFVVENLPGAAGNPTGLRVEIAGTVDEIPEPGTYLLIGSGLVLTALARRRYARRR